jgi:hypothetical protein
MILIQVDQDKPHRSEAASYLRTGLGLDDRRQSVQQSSPEHLLSASMCGVHE